LSTRKRFSGSPLHDFNNGRGRPVYKTRGTQRHENVGWTLLESGRKHQRKVEFPRTALEEKNDHIGKGKGTNGTITIRNFLHRPQRELENAGDGFKGRVGDKKGGGEGINDESHIIRQLLRLCLHAKRKKKKAPGGVNWNGKRARKAWE